MAEPLKIDSTRQLEGDEHFDAVLLLGGDAGYRPELDSRLTALTSATRGN